MKPRGGNAKGKGRIRQLSRKGTRGDKSPAVKRKDAAPRRPTLCERCGALYVRQTWRRDHRVTDALLARTTWGRCPACEQVRGGEYFGRIVVRGTYAQTHADTVRRRIENVAARAQFTQPERRVVSVSSDASGFEVLTTSQKLAHRIVRELKKAFGGKSTYAWSDRDGSLFATWQRDVSAESRRS